MSSKSYMSGVLPCQWIRDAIACSWIRADAPIVADQVQPNSLDLRIGDIGYRVRCSFLPGPEGLSAKLARYKWYDVQVSEHGTVLERDHVYLFPLQEHLVLPADVAARANPKSSTGRLDVFTRVVTEHGTAFDDLPAGYRGRLYVEIVPRSFAIIVRPGDSLAQVRFCTGNPEVSVQDLAALLDAEAIVLSETMRPLRGELVRDSAGLFLSMNLAGNDETIGFRARKHAPPIDLRAPGNLSIRQYWERIYARGNEPVILDPGEFYIFASREFVRLPGEYCAEMVPFDAGRGELRTHYAGFFDSGFGYHPDLPPQQTAASVVLEVRSRDVPFIVEHGNPIFRITLLRNAAPPEALYGSDVRSHYQSQRLRLSKQFNASADSEREPESASQLRLAF